MTNTLRSAAFAVLFACAAACGGASDDTATSSQDLNHSFEPIAAFGQVTKAAAPYTSNVVAVSLQAQRAKGSRATSVSGYTWIWTVMGDNGTFVDVQVSASGATVLDAAPRRLYAGQGTFDPATVLVDGADLLTLARLFGLDTPSALSLGTTLATEGSGPRWAVTADNGTLIIDGVTGESCGE